MDVAWTNNLIAVCLCICVCSYEAPSTVESTTNRSQSQTAASSSMSSSLHSESSRTGQESDLSLPQYGVQHIPQTYTELAEPWIKVRSTCKLYTDKIMLPVFRQKCINMTIHEQKKTLRTLYNTCVKVITSYCSKRYTPLWKNSDGDKNAVALKHLVCLYVLDHCVDPIVYQLQFLDWSLHILLENSLIQSRIYCLHQQNHHTR